VDIDQCGLVANGKSYELSRRGYFPHRRGERGYQMSAAWLGGSQGGGITLGLRLDSGNTHCAVRFREMVELSEDHCPSSCVRRRVVYRVDGGYGSQPQIRWMVATDRLVVAKATTTRPQKWADKVAPEGWQRVDGSVRVAEVEGGPHVRAVVCEVTPSLSEKRVEYSVLLTNLSATEFDAPSLWHLYSGRQSIEAFFKMGRGVYGLGNLRSRSFRAIYAFLWLVFITHNLLQWVKGALFGGTPLAEIGTRELVERVARIPAWRERTLRGWRLHLPAQDALARLVVQGLSSPWIQLQLPLRLYET
jgi:Transposase DDE domain